MRSVVQASNKRVLTGPGRLWFGVFSTLLFYSVARFFFDLFFRSEWAQQPRTSLLIFVILTVVIANPIVRWLLLPRMLRPVTKTPMSGLRVAVATTFVPNSEPLSMLERTVQAMAGMNYPHETWVLDEGDSAEVKQLCARLGAHHFSRKNISKYQTDSGTYERSTKHGNYNAWLDAIAFDRYDIIVSFDPDHVPAPSFLEKVLGYFEDPKVGYVQVAQAYYNQKASFVAAGAAEETYDYYSTLQMASYSFGYPVLIGCHNTHRCSALREVGGFAAHDADDLLITILYRSRGWQGIYVPEILARGLTPVDWRGYLTQQRRWARSVLDIKLKRQSQLPGTLPLRTRAMSYLHGLNYLQPGLVFVATLWVLIFSLIQGQIPAAFAGVRIASFAWLAGGLSACQFFRQRFFLDPVHEWGFHLRARILRIAKSPILLWALVDVLFEKRKGYELTAKVKGGRGPRLLLVVFGCVAILIAAAWGYGTTVHDSYPIALHAAAGGVLLLCLGLAASEFSNFPEPYDPSIKALSDKGRLTSGNTRNLIYLRDLICELVVRDMKIRYKRSLLGVGWSLLNPLLQLLVFYLVFSWILPVHVPNFSIFLFIGILVWNWFQSSILFAATAITDNNMLIRQPGFPTAILPIVTVTTNLVNLLLALPILLLALLLNGFTIKVFVLLLPLVLVAQFLLMLSVAYFVAALQVPYRDTQYLLSVMLMLGFYLCPVFYNADSIPLRFSAIYRMNPLVHLIEAYRAILMYGRAPNLGAVFVILTGTVPLLFASYAYFRRASYRFVEET